MRYRQRIMVVLVLAAIGLVAAWGVASAESSGPGATIPSYTVANPRAGLLSMNDARADNLVASSELTFEDALAVVQAGQYFDIRANCETVYFMGSAGQSRHQIAVYRVSEEGDPELLGSDNVSFANSGPKRKTRVLVVRVRSLESGANDLRIVLRTSAKAVGMTEWVEDEDTFDFVVDVEEPTIPAREVPAPTPQPDKKPERAFLSAPAVVLPDPHVSPAPQQELLVPQPLPLDRSIIVANPRGHLTEAEGYAENFDQGHQRIITVREGDSVAFQSSYEFVWFDGPGGSAQTQLQIRMQTLGADDALLGEGSAQEQGEQAGYRMAGELAVDVPFLEPGYYTLLITVRTSVSAEDLTMAMLSDDEDRVVIYVNVLGEPEVGAISGVVISEDNDAPLERVAVRIVQPTTWQRITTVHTGPGGDYIATGLRPGEYLVYADPQEQNYLGEWWENARLREDAARVQVVADETTEGIDFALTPGSCITGRVIEDLGDVSPVEPAPIKGVLIVVGDWDTDALVAKGFSSNDGTYRIDRLPAGRYWVHADGASKGLVGEYWDDHWVRAEADQVSVAAGEEVVDIDFALRYGGYIAGRVVGVRETTQPTPFKVAAYGWDSGELVQTANVGIGGRYWMSLPVGDYRVYAYDDDGHFGPEYYDDVTDPAEATRVIVTATDWPRDIDFQLELAGVAVLQIDPLLSQVMPGDAFSVAVWVRDVADLAAFSLEIAYDADIVHATGVELGDFLGSTGRTVVAVDPAIDNEAGLLAYGAATFGTAAGPQGDGTLAVITFVAQASGSTGLDLSNTQVSDTQVHAIEHQSKDARVVVTADDCIFGDLDCDCDVDVADIMQVALRWGASKGDPDYGPQYDLDGDDDIDIVDVALVASAWGNTCDDPDTTVLGSRAMASAVQPSWQPSSLATGLRLDPSEATAQVGEHLMVQVRIDEAQDLGGFEFVLEYDATQFSVTPAGVHVGDFIGSTGRSVMPFTAEVEIDGTRGSISFGAITLGPTPPGPSGAGVLATVDLIPLQPGISQVGFVSAQVMDTLGQTQEQLALQGATVTLEAVGLSFVPHITR